LQQQDSNNQALRMPNLAAGTKMIRPKETSLPRFFNFAHFKANKFKICQICTGKEKLSALFLIIKPTRCTNFSNLFLELNSTCFGQFLCPSSGVFHCTHSNGICHTGLLTDCEQDHDGTHFRPDPGSKLYDIYHRCVYSEKLLMMDKGTVRSM